MNSVGAIEQVFDILAENPITRTISRTLDWLRLPKTFINDLYKWIFGSTNTSRMQKGLFIIGSLFIFRRVVQGIAGLYWSLKWLPTHHKLENQFNEKEFRVRYGNDCWVLITGFTAGMGLSYAKVFANMGFNLVLVGRNKEKIKYALRWIGQYNDQILTKVIDIDLTANAEILRNTIKE